MHIRLALVVVSGFACIMLAAQGRYSNGLGDTILSMFIGVPAIIIYLVTLVLDTRDYLKSRTKESLYPTLLGVLMIGLISIISVVSNWDKNKPTLLRVYYDGDYNGIGIDFKTDGTFVYDDWAIGISEYSYGTFTINGNKIEIDKIISPGLTGVHFELRDVEVGPSDSIHTAKYLFQVDATGKVVDNINFRVVEDNR